MMMNKRFHWEIPALLLVFVLIFAACQNGLVEVEGTVGISAVEAPALTATPVKGGVLLEWDSVLEATGYTVWRKTGATPPIRLDSVSNSNMGKYRYTDLVSDTNELKANTAYTYTVFSSGGGMKTYGKAEATATPASIPPKGTKLEAVTGVTLELDYGANEAKVSWTIPAGAIPAGYQVGLYRDGSGFAVGSGSASVGQKSATIYFSPQDGSYEARVYATTSGGSSNYYFENGPVAASAKQKFEALFRSSGSLSASFTGNYNITTANVIDRFYVSLSNLNNIGKPGVGYTFQRAEVDELGNAGVYTDISVYGTIGDTTTALVTADLTADVLGNLQHSTVYDNRLPATHGKSYKYRIIAKKGGATQEREFDSVKVNLRQYATLSVGIGAVDSTGASPKYAVTPSLSGVKNALQTGDKLVFYYVKGGNFYAYQNGPYTKSIVEFSKAEIEAETPASKDLVIPKVAGADDYAYVVVRFEYADGASTGFTNVTGDGVGYGQVISGSGNTAYPLNSY